MAATSAFAADLTLLAEHSRPDPFGGVVEADRAAAARPSGTLTLAVPRGAYASCHLLVSLPETGEYTLDVTGPFERALYREWFHFLPKTKRYYPDALVPAALPVRARLPDAENRIERQTVQPYWLDVWVPADARPGEYALHATLAARGARTRATLTLRVLAATVPARDAIALDHNSYGTSWFAAQYPSLAKRLGERFYLSDEFFALIHAHHRVFDEHRGIYHQLGYGHGGKVGAEFAPRLEGGGRTRRVADWTHFDRHYDPLLDGSAFAGTRRGARPIPFVYLPVNPEWPASQLWWGEPGYEREFVNVVGEMERHFRAKGWTQTRFELFFNHKKRYKAFHWDGDETRFLRDMPYLGEYARLLKKAVPADTPVRFVFRADASWQMERQFRELAGIVNFWVCGGGMFGWYADWLPKLKARGDIVWTYGGTPAVDDSAARITVDLLRTWIAGVDGFVRWQTVAPGPDPWFAFAGGRETLVYPGDRFGIDGPLASVRLKLQRNALQDLALIDGLGLERAAVAREYNGTRVEEWLAGRPPLADGNPEEWTNLEIDEALPEDARFGKSLDAAAWQRVRAWAYARAGVGRR